MLVIPCPWCGDRCETEFQCAGPQRAPRPADAMAVTAEQWVDFLCVRPNPKGWLRELWWHARGCGSWFEIERDTATHEIRAGDIQTNDPRDAG